jgi:hypothetical protein
MLALTSSAGKLGSATLHAILEHKLISLSELLILTSSDINSPKANTAKSLRIQIRTFDFNPPDPSAFARRTKIFLVFTPQISLDFNNAPPGEGREKHHIAAIEAARSVV